LQDSMAVHCVGTHPTIFCHDGTIKRLRNPGRSEGVFSVIPIFA
jgi:hypothetical protein